MRRTGLHDAALEGAIDGEVAQHTYCMMRSGLSCMSPRNFGRQHFNRAARREGVECGLSRADREHAERVCCRFHDVNRALPHHLDQLVHCTRRNDLHTALAGAWRRRAQVAHCGCAQDRKLLELNNVASAHGCTALGMLEGKLLWAGKLCTDVYRKRIDAWFAHRL